MNRTLHIVLHDVAPPTWEACRRVMAALDEVGQFEITLLAVPRFHGATRDRAFERWLARLAQSGHEVALHGYDHQDLRPARGPRDWLIRRVYTRSEGEFFDIDRAEAERRLDAGLRWLRDLEIEPCGFVAPAWLMSPGAWQALQAFDFAYTCTLRDICLLGDGTRLTAQSQVFSTSTAWRRGMSTLWNRALALSQRNAPVVRLELHPNDAQHRNIRSCWQTLLRDQAVERRVETLQALVTRLAPPHGVNSWQSTAPMIAPPRASLG